MADFGVTASEARLRNPRGGRRRHRRRLVMDDYVMAKAL
jgi:hypothetical protein